MGNPECKGVPPQRDRPGPAFDPHIVRTILCNRLVPVLCPVLEYALGFRANDYVARTTNGCGFGAPMHRGPYTNGNEFRQRAPRRGGVRTGMGAGNPAYLRLNEEA